jgi:hypothetical protein
MMPRVTKRRIDVDLVRFLALFAMFVAHVAPTAGPGGVFTMSEFVTMPLFALLVGVGAQLGEWRARETGDRARWWRSMLVRAVLLIAVGLLLERAGAAVLIVLVHLGVLVIVMDLLARLHWWFVAAAGGLAFVVTSTLVERMGDQLIERSLEAAMRGEAWQPGWWWETQVFLWGYEPYRLGSMIVYGCVGVLLTRWWLRREETPRWHQLAGGGAALAVVAVLLAGRVTGRIELHPYSGTYLETAFNAALVAAVLGLGLWGAAFVPGVIARPLAATGAMTLTIYALHVYWLAYYVTSLRPGASDDNWTNLAILTVGSVVFALLWTLVVRRGPFRRGPLEGVAALVIR